MNVFCRPFGPQAPMLQTRETCFSAQLAKSWSRHVAVRKKNRFLTHLNVSSREIARSHLTRGEWLVPAACVGRSPVAEHPPVAPTDGRRAHGAGPSVGLSSWRNALQKLFGSAFLQQFIGRVNIVVVRTARLNVIVGIGKALPSTMMALPRVSSVTVAGKTVPMSISMPSTVPHMKSV